MAQSNVPVTSGSGNNIDTWTTTTNSQKRQGIVIADPSVDAAVAGVVSADPGPSSTAYGQIVRLAGSAQVQIAGSSGSIAVYFDRGNPSVSIGGSTGSLAVYFDRGNPSVNIQSQTATLNVALDPGHTLGAISSVGSVTNTIAVYFDRGNPSVNIGSQTGTLNVALDPGHTLGNIATLGNITNTVGVYFDRANPSVNVGTPTITGITNTIGVYFDRANPSVSIGGASSSVGIYFDRGNPTVTANAGSGTFNVSFSPATPSVSVTSVTNTVAVYFDRGNPSVTVSNVGTGSMGVFFSGSNPAVNPSVAYNSGVTGATTQRVVHVTDVATSINIVAQGLAFLNVAHTAGIFSASGSATSQGGAGLNTVISPSANYNFKIFAFSLTTTGIVSNNVRFTNGSSAGGGELWRVAMQSSSGVASGANLAVTPPGYLFATGTNTTLALYLGEASIIHYSVAYIKETA